jgi:hypothetical protein
MIDLPIADIVRAWVMLLMIATLYDRLVVDRIERLKPSIGVTSWEVVGGVAFTLLVFGMLAGFDNMLLAFVLFSASGIPMILGAHNRHATAAG